MWFPGVTSQCHANNASLMLVAQGLTDSRILKIEPHIACTRFLWQITPTIDQRTAKWYNELLLEVFNDISWILQIK